VLFLDLTKAFLKSTDRMIKRGAIKPNLRLKRIIFEGATTLSITPFSIMTLSITINKA
jgi:hypothetical protein